MAAKKRETMADWINRIVHGGKTISEWDSKERRRNLSKLERWSGREVQVRHAKA